MKNKQQNILTAILLCLALLFSFVGCKNNPDPKPAQTPVVSSQPQTPPQEKPKNLILDYTVQTNWLYTDDLSPGPFINGYAKIYYWGTVENRIDYNGPGNTFHLMDAQGNLLFDTPYHEISNVNPQGLTAVHNLYYEHEYSYKTVSEYYVFNTKKQIVETIADEETFRAKYEEIEPDGSGLCYDRNQTNTKGLKVTINEVEVDEKKQYQYCILDEKGTLLHLLTQKENNENDYTNGSIWFLTEDLIVCGFGAGNYGWGTYFQLYRTDGTQVRNDKFQQIGNFDNGYAPVVLNNKLGLVNAKGEFAVEPCIAIGDMRWVLLSENKIIINDNKHIGIVEVKEVADMKVNVVTDYSVDTGLLFPIANNLTPIYHLGKQGFVYANSHGELLPQVYDMAYPFENGQALVNIAPKQWFYINEKGERVGDGEQPENPATTEIYLDDEELRGIKQGDQKLTEPIFTWIASVSDDMNFAQLAQGEHKNVMIDPMGNVKVTLPDDCIGAVKKGENLILRFEKGVQLADITGKVLNQTYFSGIGNFENGLAAFTLDGKVGLITKDGTVKTEPTLSMDAITPAYGEGKIVGTLHGKLIVITVTL